MTKHNPLKNIDIRDTEWGKTYRVRVFHGGKSYSATRDSLKEAIEWRDETKHLLKTGQTLPGDIPAGDMTLGEASDKFLQSVIGKSKATTNQYLWAQKQLLTYFDETTLLSEITPAKMNEYMVHRMKGDGVGASKICQELSFIRLVYDNAQIWGVNLTSPERSIKRPRKNTSSREEKRDRVILPEELVALANQANQIDKQLYYFLIFLLYTGMRPSEAASLRWERLPLKHEKQAIKHKQHVGYIDLPRGGCSMVGTKTEPRFVPLHKKALKIINSLKNENYKERALIFIPDDHGQKNVPYQYFRWKFRRVKNETRLTDGSNLRENIDFYSFRHTSRTRMAKCGVQDSAAELIIGHADREMLRTYTHYEDADLIKEIEKLSFPELAIAL